VLVWRICHQPCEEYDHPHEVPKGHRNRREPEGKNGIVFASVYLLHELQVLPLHYRPVTNPRLPCHHPPLSVSGLGFARKPGLIPNVTGARDAPQRARKSDDFRVVRPKPQQQNEVESSFLRRAQARS
jgi:hypothetical protein